MLLLHLSLLQSRRTWSLEYSPLWVPPLPPGAISHNVKGSHKPSFGAEPPLPSSLCSGRASNQEQETPPCGSLASLSLSHHLPLLQPLPSKGNLVSAWQCGFALTQYLLSAWAAWRRLCLGQLQEDRALTYLSARVHLAVPSRAPGTHNSCPESICWTNGWLSQDEPDTHEARGALEMMTHASTVSSLLRRAVRALSASWEAKGRPKPLRAATAW